MTPADPDVIEAASTEPARPRQPLGPAQLAEAVRTLALDQHERVTLQRRPLVPVGPRLARAEAVLAETYQLLARDAQQGRGVTPAAEWILDNYYVVVEQSALVREHLAPAYYRLLPRLTEGPLRGLPRVYELVHDVAVAVDNAITPDVLRSAVDNYQRVEPLRLAELWAVPIMVRLVSVERLAARAGEMRAGRADAEEAERWARRFADLPDDRPEATLALLREIDAQLGAPTLSFLVRLREQVGAGRATSTLLHQWIEQHVGRRGETSESALRAVAQVQTQRQISVRHAVQTLRTTAEVDWGGFVEEASLVERMLRLDPAGVYPDMDRATRNRYRLQVERLARRSRLTEFEVAEALVVRAERRAEDPSVGAAPDLGRHIGYDLLDDGRRDLERSLGYRPSVGERLRRAATDYPTTTYLGFVGAVWAGGLALVAASLPSTSAAWVALSLLAAALPLLDVALSVVNGTVTHALPPRLLPKLSFEGGLPDDARTLVVVPTMLSSPEQAREQVARMEERALANPANGLYFALLTDFHDAAVEVMPGDRPTLDAAAEAVRSLNARYALEAMSQARRLQARAELEGAPPVDAPLDEGARGDRFFLLHRARRWNERQQAWMGWERKRGKLDELNRLLLDPDAETSYTAVVGDFEGALAAGPFRFVLTLDADTALPPGTARRLAEAAAHPLNRPVVDAEAGRVVRGYGVLQPRVAIDPESAARTPFSRLYAGRIGVDPYTTATSDVYQDLFGEGIYAGKGLYDVAAFHAVLGGVLPENRVLSHDLLEGSHARAAYVSDIALYDDYPSTYLSFAKRLHRWVRGDWQIAAWLGRRVPHPGTGPFGDRAHNPLPMAARWRIVDNLRRSLTPVAHLALLGLGWTVLPGAPGAWTALAVGALLLPHLAGVPDALLRRPRYTTWRQQSRYAFAAAVRALAQALFALAVLPHQALLVADAIARTLWRLRVSHRNLLEWTTASQVEQATKNEGGAIARAFGGATVLSVAVGVLVALARPTALSAAGPVVLLWLLAPAGVWWLSRPGRRPPPALTDADRAALRRQARRTWRYFERYAGASAGWLPPDNVQVEPARPAAARTSPTNVGLGLLAAQAACDFGYLPRGALLDRLGHALDALAHLDRFRGHPYNWVRVPGGEPLAPRYVSTVDSGNLAAALVALRQALLEAPGAAWPSPAFLAGLHDTAGVVRELVDDLAAALGAAPRWRDGFAEALGALDDVLDEAPPRTLGAWWGRLHALRPLVGALAALPLPDAAAGQAERPAQQALRAALDDWRRQPLAQVERLFAELDAGTGGRLHSGPLPGAVDAARSWASLRSALVASADDLPGPDGRRALAQVEAWLAEAEALARQCEDEVARLDFGFLYVPEKRLFAIGYNVDRATLDASTYDLLASEARLASFLAVARGAVATEHWFHLGRRLVALDGRAPTEGGRALSSWSGTLFEYLMPLLVMRRFPGSLLDETYRAVVDWQQRHGRRRGAPWGVSESAYHQLGIDLDYQYRAFGTPLLGLKRGLAEDYVAAPYATHLALAVDPAAAVANLGALRRLGAYGALGYYDAVDFTPARLDDGADHAVVATYMAHHQGMALVALANAVLGDVFVRRFHADPYVRAHELLLQERVPLPTRLAELHPLEVDQEPSEERTVAYHVEHVPRGALDGPVPRVALLSNGRLSTLVTAAGSGGTRFAEADLTRWHPDRVRDAAGLALYVRDLERGSRWSAGHQPLQREADRYDVWFHPGKVEMARVDDWVETFTEVAVSPEDDVELRSYSLTNYAQEARHLEVTAFAEVALAPRSADAAHPAFSKLFVRTEALPDHHAVLAHRRPRAPGEAPLWMMAAMTVGDGDDEARLTLETDRLRFVGRGRSAADPQALDARDGEAALSETVGFVLDPCVALRRTVRLGPGEKVRVTVAIGAGRSRGEVVRLAARYASASAVERGLNLAAVYGLVEQEHVGLDGPAARRAQDLAAALLYGDPRRRAAEAVLRANRGQQAGLWAYGISGDLPLAVCRVADGEALPAARFLLQAHAYWRSKGVEADLLLLHARPASYADALRDALLDAVEASPSAGRLNQRGGVFVRSASEIPEGDLALLLTAARLVVDGPLDQLGGKAEAPGSDGGAAARGEAPGSEGGAAYVPATERPLPPDSAVPFEEALRHRNGVGGFVEDEPAFVLQLTAGPDGRPALPPKPWSNVLANEAFGCLVTERGIGTAWSENSRENRLTPWSNDAVEDPPSEAWWVRDAEGGVFWSPLPGPTPSGARYEVRHAPGATTYRHRYAGLDQETTVAVPPDAPLKLTRLRLTNRTDRVRRLSVVAYARWVLGVQAEQSGPFVVTRYDADARTLFARNAYNGEFAGRTAFAAVGCSADAEVRATADRAAFLGRHGALEAPAALTTDAPLNGRAGAGLDPCAAFEVTLLLGPREAADVVLVIGEAATDAQARELVVAHASPDAAERAVDAATAFWAETLGRVQIETPVPEIDLVVNAWAPYQNLACRVWGRTAFYQSGGAYGFRDQLQDVLALLMTRPDLARAQLLRHAARQFPEGDVLHWWHPPTGRGIRSRFSDDLAWLPYAAGTYVAATGDRAVLDEVVPFVEARALEPGEDEAYLVPRQADASAPLYEHAARALDRACTTGPHGLPLMGAGDWNDGMNRIGHGGRGESVWLACFLTHVIDLFLPLCRARGDDGRAAGYVNYQARMEEAVNAAGWDGGWYRRAFYDDGTPVGSAESDECRIDGLVQAWSVIAAVAPPARARLALDAVERALIGDGLLRLLTPPFDRTERDPGYIKGYPPGVRENGGQYTHAALWMVRAFAEQGRHDRAAELLAALSPVRHARTPEAVARYETEPYAVAADVYGVPPHVGQGGWTWYTGSAGWYVRVALESVLGVRLEHGSALVVAPRMPAAWPHARLRWRTPDGTATYAIEIENPDGLAGTTAEAWLDGDALPVEEGQVRVPIREGRHTVRVRVG